MDKREILDQLARKEITREEAEVRIRELEAGPETAPQPSQPPAPPRRRGGLGLVVLILVIVGAVVVVPLVLVVGAAAFWRLKAAPDEPFSVSPARITELQQATGEAKGGPPSSVPPKRLSSDSSTVAPSAPSSPTATAPSAETAEEEQP